MTEPDRPDPFRTDGPDEVHRRVERLENRAGSLERRIRLRSNGAMVFAVGFGAFLGGLAALLFIFLLAYPPAAPAKHSTTKMFKCIEITAAP